MTHDDFHTTDRLPKGSEVAVLQGLVNTMAGEARAEGSKKGFLACGLKVVAEQTAERDRAKGQAVTETILAGNPNIKGIFGSNENMALGAIQALKAAAELQKIIVVGFDANPDAAALILAGEMSASVAQAPKKIGATGIQALVDLKAGKALPPVIDTETVLVTKENAEDYIRHVMAERLQCQYGCAVTIAVPGNTGQPALATQ